MNLDLTKDLEARKKRYEYDMFKEREKQIYNNPSYKTELLNIDSQYRNKIPKNIYTATVGTLPINPIITKRGSTLVQVNYPNHNFNIGDQIIVQNVKGSYKILNNGIYLIDKFQYMVINYANHNIPLDYNTFYDKYQILIEIISDIGNEITYENIPINSLLGIFNINLASQVDKTVPISPTVLSIFNANTASDLDNDYILIELPYNFIISSSPYYSPPDVFKISFLNIGGIPLPYINADFPVNYSRYKGFQQIENIDSNNIYFDVPINASSTLTSGGKDVQIMLITNTMPGFPDANTYTINLKKNFNNVVRIELVSTEFPFIDFLIKSTGKVNNRLYWKHLDDGNTIYQATIPEGNYNVSTLVSTITTVLNNVPRLGSTIQNQLYNIFEINLDSYTQEFTFSPYKNNRLPNSLSANLVEIENIKYVQLTVYHPGNLVEELDTVVISGAAKIGTILDATYINTTHTVYKINTTEQTYSILLAPLNQITNQSTIDLTGNGGPTTVIKTRAKVSFLFNYSNTIGSIIGFKDVGQTNAITAFKTVISNFDSYPESTNLNQVGNPDNSIQLINLTGSNYYILMYINDYENILNNSNQPTAFAKILLSGSPGDILFNTFVNYPLEFDFPISTVNQFSIYFTYPDGTLVDFRNMEHSFTLRIIEKISKPYNTGINSKDTSFYETIKQGDINIHN